MRILILDDNAALAQILGVSLRSEGHFVLVFTSPHEALKHIHEADVLVTDYHMPGMTGLEVAKRAYEQGGEVLFSLCPAIFQPYPNELNILFCGAF